MGGACERCLRRAWLLERLAVHIERVNAARRGFRAAELLALGDDALVAAVAPRETDAIRREAEFQGASAVAARIGDSGCWTTCIHDDAYPGGLHDLGEGAPRALFCLGDVDLLPALRESGTVVSIVGARRATAYGLDTARELAGSLAHTSMTVVSGMAHGIDGEAHRGALDAGGITATVLAGGPDVAYPATHARLHREIVERGLVISELPPGVEPLRWMFPARNRTIAALGGMTIVVQAGQRSGSLITARHALELGREVGAVPGEVRHPASRGANALIGDGAALISDAQDVLDRLVHVSASAPAVACGPPLDPDARRALAAVEAGRATGDTVSAAAELSGQEAAIALAELELSGYVRSVPGAGFVRTGLRTPDPG